MTMLGIRVRFDTIRTLDFSSISSTYMGVGSGMSHPVREMILKNETNAALWVSFDGINDQHHLSAGQVDHYDFTSNKSKGDGYFLAQGDRLYVRSVGSDPTSGTVYLTTMYATDSAPF